MGLLLQQGEFGQRHAESDSDDRCRRQEVVVPESRHSRRGSDLGGNACCTADAEPQWQWLSHTSTSAPNLYRVQDIGTRTQACTLHSTLEPSRNDVVATLKSLVHTHHGLQPTHFYPATTQQAMPV